MQPVLEVKIDEITKEKNMLNKDIIFDAQAPLFDEHVMALKVHNWALSYIDKISPGAFAELMTILSMENNK